MLISFTISTNRRDYWNRSQWNASRIHIHWFQRFNIINPQSLQAFHGQYSIRCYTKFTRNSTKTLPQVGAIATLKRGGQQSLSFALHSQDLHPKTVPFPQKIKPNLHKEGLVLKIQGHLHPSDLHMSSHFTKWTPFFSKESPQTNLIIFYISR